MTQPSIDSMNNDYPTLNSLQATRKADVDNKKLAAWVKEQYQDMKTARTKQEMIWYVNLAFYRGNQYVELVPRLGKLSVPKAPPYRVRHVSNRIKPIIRTEFARLTSQKPSASVIPATSDDEDLMAAYAGEQIWESVSNRANLETEFANAIWWTLITGNSFMKVWWDQNRVDYDGAPQGIPGDICFGHVTPFHLFVPDLREVSIQNQPYVLNVYTKPLQWVKKFYSGSFDTSKLNNDVVAQNEIMNDAYLNLDSSNVNRQPDSVLCMEMWAKDGASDLFEGNKVIHVIGDQVVSVSDMYNHGRYPFVHFAHIPSGTFYRTAVIEDLIALQREYNRTRSQIIENKNRMARLQLLAPIGSVDVTKITNEPGQVIQYRPGLPPPAPMPLQAVPNYVIEELNRTVQDMEDISGQHEVSRGGVPPGVTAATAISYLQEKDDSLMSHTFSNVERGMEEIARQTLALVQQFWDSPRMVKVVGDEGFFDTLMLKGSELNGNTDIRMEGGSSLPTSKAAKQALLMDMMKMGFIDPNDGLKIMDIGGVQKLWQRLKRDESQAQRENIRMKNVQPDMVDQFRAEWEQTQMAEMEMATMLEGQEPEEPFKTIDTDGMPMTMPSIIPVNSWDNHDVHIEVHNGFRKSQAFELLPDKIKAQFELHVNMHLMAVQQAMMEVQMMQMGGMGMPGEMPPGEEPPPGPGQEPPPGESGPPPMPGGM